MNTDLDTSQQIEAFYHYLEDSGDSRNQSTAGAYAHTEEEWEAFQSGWNAAKQHFKVQE